ncbi:porin family protein [Candidatus Neomarinimicrobiota bacterium]
MQKVIYLFFIFVIVGYSQTSESNLNIGIIGGLNINSAEVEILDEGADVSSNTVFGIGGVIDWRLNQTFSLRLEPMYLQKGIGKTEVDINPGIYWYSNSSYLEIPVLIKAEFGKSIKPYFILGPSIGLLLNTEVTAEINNITFKGDSKIATENYDVSLSFGCGINYPISRFSIFVEARYLYGLSNTIKGGLFKLSYKNVAEELEWSKDTDKILNRGLQIMTGITFPI